MLTSWLPALMRIYAQTMAMSALFMLAGALVLRVSGLRTDGDREHAALTYGRAYFIGLSACLALFVGLSRLIGAHRGLALTLGALVVASIVGQLRGPTLRPSRRTLTGLLLAFTLLVLLFSATTLACWLTWDPSRPSGVPSAWHHFGSIHAGRYANYSVFIDREDRIPFLAQNMGQSMLAAFHLLLGVHAPLAALMAWVPHSLAALTLLVFGAFRARGLSRAWSAAGTFFVFFCNIGLAWRALFVFDNGSPLALIGYTDLIVAIATFLMFAAWLEQVGTGGLTPGARLLPGLWGLTWCWYAPQNVVLAIPTAGAAFWAQRWRTEGFRGPPRRAFGIAAAVFAVSVVAGATQLGPFLPRTWQEGVGTLTILPSDDVKVRPYVQYVTSHWSAPKRKWTPRVGPAGNLVVGPRIYERLSQGPAAAGPGAWAGAMLALITELGASLRTYFFPVSGLALLGLAARGSRVGRASLTAPPRRFWIALAAFGAGFAVAFVFEYGGLKWWLTRFLVPGTALSLLWGFETLAEALSRLAAPARRALLGAVLVVASYGPLAELAWVCRENFVRTRDIDPLGHRLALLVTAQGPYDSRIRP